MGIIDYYYGGDNASPYFGEPDPIGDNHGQAFRMGGSAIDIISAKFRLFVVVAAGADMITFAAKIYACTGTPGIDGMQTGEALATSDPIEYTDNTDPDWVEFTFSTPYTLEANTNYCLVLECTGWVEEIYSEGVTSYDDESPTHDGNHCYNIDGTPGYNVDEDYNFYAYSAYGAGSFCGVSSPGKVNGIATANISKIIGV